MKDLSTTKILDVKLSTEKKGYILEKIIKRLKEEQGKFYIVTPNPELLMHALKQSEYKDILNQAQFSLPDGIGVLMASKFMKKGVSERITGSDFMVELVRECAKEGLTVGFFGGRPGVAEMTADCLQKFYKDLKVVYASGTWDKKKLKEKRIDMLFVALGSPKQEKWIAENLEELPVTGVMGVGGAFDFISGKVKRAPKFIRKIGLEWLFRLIVEPWRIKRQINLVKFIFIVIREKFTASSK